MFFAVADIVNRLDSFQGEQLMLHDAIKLGAAPGEHSTGRHAQQALLELARCRDLATGEGVQHARLIVREIDAEVVPGLIRHFVALEVQGLREAVCDLDNRTALTQCLVATLALREYQVFLPLGFV
ncbi:hypothetical protein D3C81_1228560 [compost metagenome]